MNRYRDKRAAFVLALLLVLVFAFGQARRADADRQAGADQVGLGPAAEGGQIAGATGAGATAAALHD